MKNMVLLFIFLFSIGNIWAQSAQSKSGQIDAGVHVKVGAQSSNQYKGNYQTWADYVIGTSLLISLIPVIYHLTNNTGKGKKAVVQWFIALIIYFIIRSVWL